MSGSRHIYAWVITLPHLIVCNTLQHTATRCNTLQHAATHCNTLQHTATCMSHYHAAPHCLQSFSLVSVAVCCSVLQCVAVCCSVLQCVAVWILSSHDISSNSLHSFSWVMFSSLNFLKSLSQIIVITTPHMIMSDTRWRRRIGCLIFIGHFPQKNPIIIGPFAKYVYVQLKASYGTLPLCTMPHTEDAHPL